MGDEGAEALPPPPRSSGLRSWDVRIEQVLGLIDEAVAGYQREVHLRSPGHDGEGETMALAS